MKRAAASAICLLLAFCGSRTIVPGGESFSFSDSDNFSVTVPMRKVGAVKTEQDSTRTFEFREGQGDEPTAVIRIRVLEVKSPDDLFAPSYESSFLGSCDCAVSKRGVIHVDDLAAREYVVSTRNSTWLGYQRHIAREKKIIVLEVNGPADQDVRLQSMFKTVTDSLRFITN